MTTYTNEYFGRMLAVGVLYEEQKCLRMREREKIVNSKNKEALNRWEEREKDYPFPFSRGQTTAYKAWKESVECETEIFECNDLPWEKDIPDFVETLKEAQIDRFVLTDNTVPLIESLHSLSACGCEFVTLYKLTKKIKRWGGSDKLIIPGILIAIKK